MGFKINYSIPEKATKKEQSKLLRSDDDTKNFLSKNFIFDVSRIKQKTYEKIMNAKEITIPKKNCQTRIRTQSQINLISVIFIFADKYNIEELTISTYTLNKEALSVLLQLYKAKKIRKLNLLIASSYTFRSQEHYQFIKNECANFKKVKLTFANLHFKITLIKTKNDFFQIEGSMNYSTNNLAEQILIENSKDTYDFDYNLLNVELRKKINKNLEIVQ